MYKVGNRNTRRREQRKYSKQPVFAIQRLHADATQPEQRNLICRKRDKFPTIKVANPAFRNRSPDSKARRPDAVQCSLPVTQYQH